MSMLSDFNAVRFLGPALALLTLAGCGSLQNDIDVVLPS